ncbi:MAG: cytochrome-c peroxidase [Thermodesulfovibrionales bacterium]
MKREISMFPEVFLLVTFVLFTMPSCSGDSNAPATNLTPVQQIGKLLFFDKNLSSPSGQACAACHDPKAGFAEPDTGVPVSEGVLPGRFGSRNSPSASYAAFSPAPYYDPIQRPGMMGGLYIGGLFWDGRAATPAEQAKAPFLNPLEMHNPDKAQVISNIRNSSYAGLFEEVFGEGSLGDIDAAYDHAAEAIAEYERSGEVSPFTSKFDYYLAGRITLTAQEENGYNLFIGKANCKNCHAIAPIGPNDPVQTAFLFTNFAYQNIGVPKNPGNPFYALPSNLNPDGSNFIDIGHGSVVNDPMEKGKFKIPSLRNVAVTPPYMHNGVFTTLREVVVFDNTRDEKTANWPPPEVAENVHRHMPMPDGSCMPNKFGCLKLTDEEVDAIVTFLSTLTDGFQVP